ncbi:consensus disorder prediction [Desulfoluna spongiiphila]|nr:consensus disorder prediction [Desulfoluna spongiiphila]
MKRQQDELKCKCTRCRNTHAESDRPESYSDKEGFQHSECPRCGGRTFTRMGACSSQTGKGQ